jgi:hypothetical protein
MYKSRAQHIYLSYDSEHLAWMMERKINVSLTMLCQGDGEMLITRIKIALGEPI